MNSIKNNVQLLGRIGSEVEIKSTEKGIKCLNLSLAVDESYKNEAGEKVPKTLWVDLTLWSKTAELATGIIQKGNRVIVKGKLTNETWEDKEGNKRKSTSVTVNEFLNLEPKKDS